MNKKVLPKNTELTEYLFSHEKIFGLTKINDSVYLLKIVHTWGDGEIMDYGWDTGSGVNRFPTEFCPNPRHIVMLFPERPSQETIDLETAEFLKDYCKPQYESAAP